jgi:hypothetical protein
MRQRSISDDLLLCAMSHPRLHVLTEPALDNWPKQLAFGSCPIPNGLRPDQGGNRDAIVYELVRLIIAGGSGSVAPILLAIGLAEKAH